MSTSDSTVLETTAGQMLPGDVLYDTGVGPVNSFTIADIQFIGPLVIVDFADHTASAPIPAATPVRVRRLAIDPERGSASLAMASVLAAFSGVDACLHATDGCRAACLNRSGHGRFDSTVAARAWRSAFFLAHPLHFVRLLMAELERWARRFKRDEVRGAVRLNVVSDHDWSVICPEFLRWILRVFGRGSGYDYTASPDTARHARHRALGWDLSLSVKCADQLGRYLSLLDEGWVNRLVVVLGIRAKKVAGALPALPSSFEGRALVDGDVHDYRPADGLGVIVGLRVKDTFGHSTVDIALTSGFALEVAA